MTTAHNLSPSANRPFRLQREFNAPRDLVWQAWTDPKHLSQWFGPKGVTIAKCAMDLRPGGLFHYCMKTPDGHEMWGRWRIIEIVPLEKLVTIVAFSDAAGGVTRHPLSATWPLETKAVTTFTEVGDKTLMELEWSAYQSTDEERRTFDAGHESMKAGWGGTMVQLDAYLASVTGR